MLVCVKWGGREEGREGDGEEEGEDEFMGRRCMQEPIEGRTGWVLETP